MQFLSPWFFAAMAALAVPVIIHLLNLRKPQTLKFSTVAFFKVLQQSTIRRIRIKKWLLLFLRMMALALLVLALMRPYMPSGMGVLASGNQPRLYLILADNSLSMARLDQNGPYMEQAQSFLRALIAGSGTRDQFVLIPTNGEWNATGRMDAGRFRETVESLEPIASGNYIDERFERLMTIAREPGEHAVVIYVVGDMQASQLEPLSGRVSNGSSPEGIPVQAVQIGKAPFPNVGITDVRIRSRIVGTGRPVLVEAEITNFGSNPIENVFVTMETGGLQGGQHRINLAPGEVSSRMFEFLPDRSGHTGGRIYLEGDAFTADDERFFTVSVPEALSVLYISDDQAESRPVELQSYLLPVLTAAQETSGRINVETGNTDRLNQLEGYQAVVLDGLRNIPESAGRDLQSFVQDGRSLVILPGERGDQDSYNKLLNLFGAPSYRGFRGDYGSFQSVAKLGRLSRDHPVLEDLFELRDDEDVRVEIPDLYHYWMMDVSVSDRARVLFESNLSEPLFVEQPYGSGVVLMSGLGADPGWGNLPAKPLFAPLYYQLVLYAAAREPASSAQVILGQGLDLTERFASQQVTATLNGVDYRPEARITRNGVHVRYPGREWTPGIIALGDGLNHRLLAANLPAAESDFRVIDRTALEQLFSGDVYLDQMMTLETGSEEEFTRFLSAAGMGREIWQFFLLAGILILMLESFVSRWYKAENI